MMLNKKYSDCILGSLSRCGLHRTVREVVDFGDYYYIITEYLECGKCKRKVAAWNTAILGQLDVAK